MRPLGIVLRGRFLYVSQNSNQYQMTNSSFSKLGGGLSVSFEALSLSICLIYQNSRDKRIICESTLSSIVR